MYVCIYIYGHFNEKMMLNHISPICSQPLFQCGELNAINPVGEGVNDEKITKFTGNLNGETSSWENVS